MVKNDEFKQFEYVVSKLEYYNIYSKKNELFELNLNRLNLFDKLFKDDSSVIKYEASEIDLYLSAFIAYKICFTKNLNIGLYDSSLDSLRRYNQLILDFVNQIIKNNDLDFSIYKNNKRNLRLHNNSCVKYIDCLSDLEYKKYLDEDINLLICDNLIFEENIKSREKLFDILKQNKTKTTLLSGRYNTPVDPTFMPIFHSANTLKLKKYIYLGINDEITDPNIDTVEEIKPTNYCYNQKMDITLSDILDITRDYDRLDESLQNLKYLSTSTNHTPKKKNYEYFRKQIDGTSNVNKDKSYICTGTIYDSGKIYTEGDKILFALLLDEKSEREQYKIIALKEDEIDDYDIIDKYYNVDNSIEIPRLRKIKK